MEQIPRLFDIGHFSSSRNTWYYSTKQFLQNRNEKIPETSLSKYTTRNNFIEVYYSSAYVGIAFLWIPHMSHWSAFPVQTVVYLPKYIS